MAESWGSAVSNWRGGCNAWVTSETDTTATIRVVSRWQSLAWGFNVWNGNTAYVECDGQSSGWVSVGSVYSATGATVTSDMYYQDFTVSKTENARNVWCYAEFHLGAYQAGNSGNGVTLTIGGINYSTPSSPSGIAVTRSSDTSQKLTWGGNNTNSYSVNYWKTVDIRRIEDAGSETAIKTGLGNSTTNYTDSSTSAGHYYRYRVCPWNGNFNTSAGLVGVYTTPKAPSSVEASKVGTSDVSLAIVTDTYSIDSVQVQQTVDEGATWTDTDGSWTGTGTSSSKRTLTFTPTEVPAGTVKYRARFTKASGGSSSSTLTSAYTESNSVTTITPPLAPAVTASPSVIAVDGSVSVTWTPNHPDSTAQTKAQVEVTAPDGTVTTTDIEGETASSAFTADQTGTYQVRVRTYGLYEEWGEWSSYSTVRSAVAPQAWFSTPATDGEVIEATPYEVTWEVSDETGVAAQTFELVSGGQSLISETLATDARSYTFSSQTYALANLTGYTLRITVQAGSGLSVTALRTFSTDWEEPAAPIVTAAYDADQLSAQVSVRFGVEEGKPDTVDAAIYRVLADGTETLLEDGLLNGQSVVDQLAPLNTDYSYRVVAYADTDVSSETALAAYLDSGGMEAFNFGQAAETCFALGLNAQSSVNLAHSGSTHHFALGSDSPNLPQFYGDGDTDVTGSKSYVLHTRAEHDALRAQLRDPSSAVCWYRDHWGHRARVYATWSLGYAAQTHGLWDVSASLTEVVWEEPVNG